MRCTEANFILKSDEVAEHEDKAVSNKVKEAPSPGSNNIKVLRITKTMTSQVFIKQIVLKLNNNYFFFEIFKQALF